VNIINLFGTVHNEALTQLLMIDLSIFTHVNCEKCIFFYNF